MLVTISGPSTVGKDSTWVRVAESLGLSREVPFTTRPKRTTEVEGKDHRFITTKEFHELIKNNQFTEWDYVVGHYYGTGLSLENRIKKSENVVLSVLARMAIRLKRRLPNVRTILLMTSDHKMLEKRLKERGYSDRELLLRLAHGDEEIVHAPLFDIVVQDADIMSDADVERTLNEIITPP